MGQVAPRDPNHDGAIRSAFCRPAGYFAGVPKGLAGDAGGAPTPVVLLPSSALTHPDDLPRDRVDDQNHIRIAVGVVIVHLCHMLILMSLRHACLGVGGHRVQLHVLRNRSSNRGLKSGRCRLRRDAGQAVEERFDRVGCEAEVRTLLCLLARGCRTERRAAAASARLPRSATVVVPAWSLIAIADLRLLIRVAPARS